MCDHNRLMKIVLTGIICLVSIFGMGENAKAWTWKGFSELTVSGTVRGKEGETIDFTVTDMTVNAQCYNINSGNLSQPGTGNFGMITLAVTTQQDPDKDRGIVSFEGKISLSPFDDHCTDSGEYDAGPDGVPGTDDDYLVCPGPDEVLGTEDDYPHLHICHPEYNENKVEEKDTGWVSAFTAGWEWKDKNGNTINTGTDTCVLEDPQFYMDPQDGYIKPIHDQAFSCTSTSDRKIKWVLQ
jgi:hypothetical protein